MVRNYTTGVLGYEWPAHGAANTLPASQAAQAALNHLATPFTLDQQTTLRDQTLGLITDLQQNRADRLAKSAQGLPGPLLATFAVLSVVTVLLPYLLKPRAQLHSLIGLTVSVGLAARAPALVSPTECPPEPPSSSAIRSRAPATCR